MQGKHVVIVGSSIAGASLAYALAGKGFNVEVFDQKKPELAGKKVCDSIVTTDYLAACRELGIRGQDFILKEYNTAKVVSPGSSVELPIRDFKISRENLVKHLVKEAGRKGAKFNFKSRLLGMEKGKKCRLTFEQQGKKIMREADVVVGADGALSSVAKLSGLWQDREFMLGIHAYAELPSVQQDDAYTIFLGKDYGYYSYLIPIKKGFLIGRVARNSSDNMKYFTKLLENLGAKSVRMEAAMIPIHKPSLRTSKDNIFLIGDAGGHTKSSFGGIIQSIRAALSLSEQIAEGKNKRFKELKRELHVHYLLRKVLERCNDDEFNELLQALNNLGIKESMKSRDSFAKWFLKMPLRQPKLLRYALKAL